MRFFREVREVLDLNLVRDHISASKRTLYGIKLIEILNIVNQIGQILSRIPLP